MNFIKFLLTISLFELIANTAYSQKNDNWVLITDTVYTVDNADTSHIYKRVLEVYINSDKDYITEQPLNEKRLWIIPIFEWVVTDEIGINDLGDGNYLFRINFKCFTLDYSILQVWSKSPWKEIKLKKDLKKNLERYLSAGNIKQKLFDYVCNLK